MHDLIVSMSGFRGIVGDSLTPEVALRVATAFGQAVPEGPIVLGGDTRVSHDVMKHAVLTGLLGLGRKVIYIGKVPTPTVQQAISYYGASGGIVITASHNPAPYNGLKLMSQSGSFFDNDEYARFMSFYENYQPIYSEWDKSGSLIEDFSFLERHVDLILEKVDCSSVVSSGLKVLIDVNHGAGAVADPILLDKLGVKYDILYGEPSGRFSHSPEPVEQNLETLKTKMAAGGYDIGFAQDADADRLVILDEKGRFIGEDYSLAFCMNKVLDIHQAKNPAIVVNLSTSLVINYIAELFGAKLYHTKIGESFVTQGIKAYNALVGGEGNGGVIYPTVGWGRDSLAGIALALVHLADAKKTVSQIVDTYPKYVMIRDKVELKSREFVAEFLAKMEKTFAGNDINKEDGVKLIFKDGWIHVRPSNTEPIIRIFVEAINKDIADKWMTQVKGLLS